MSSLATRAFALFVVVTLSAACGARTGMVADEDESPFAEPDAATGARDASVDSPRDAGRDVSVVADAGRDAVASPICVPFDAGSGADAGTCSRSVRVTSVTKSRSTCFVDLAFAEGEIGELRYACGGGSATMVFSRGTFRGGFDGTSVDVCAGTTFDWSDGCKWDSAQRAFGDLASGEISFTYAEAPRGNGCLPPCSAVGTVEVF